MCDLLWSDPDDRGGWGISPRGAGYTFGQVSVIAMILSEPLNRVVIVKFPKLTAKPKFVATVCYLFLMNFP